jgi:hypothetical protein
VSGACIQAWVFFSFFSILWSSQTDDYWQEYLAKFGYRPDMKVEKFKNLIIFQLPAGTCCENLSNLNRAIFFSQKSFVCAKRKLRTTLDEDRGSNFLGTNLDWFEANWILELDCTLVPSLILSSPNQELSFLHCFLVWTNWFSLQSRCYVGLASICHFLVLDPRLKTLGPV